MEGRRGFYSGVMEVYHLGLERTLRSNAKWLWVPANPGQRGDLRFNRMRPEEDSTRSLRTQFFRKGGKEAGSLS